MPTPAVTLKLRRFRRRFGIAAPRVIVRSHVPWQWMAAGIFLLVTMAATAAWTLAQQGETAQLQRELNDLRGLFQAREDELLRYRSAAGTEQSAVQMERVAQQQLLAHLKALQAENAGLKEDIALFERLVPTDGDESAVRLERMRVTADQVAGRYRYRLLLGFTPSKQVRDFKGRLQLVLAVQQGGREQQIVLPGDGDAASDYQVEVRHFLRKEGVIFIPPGARLKSVEARLLQGDALKAKRLAQL